MAISSSLAGLGMQGQGRDGQFPDGSRRARGAKGLRWRRARSMGAPETAMRLLAIVAWRRPARVRTREHGHALLWCSPRLGVGQASSCRTRPERCTARTGRRAVAAAPVSRRSASPARPARSSARSGSRGCRSGKRRRCRSAAPLPDSRRSRSMTFWTSSRTRRAIPRLEASQRPISHWDWIHSGPGGRGRPAAAQRTVNRILRA